MNCDLNHVIFITNQILYILTMQQKGLSSSGDNMYAYSIKQFIILKEILFPNNRYLAYSINNKHASHFANNDRLVAGCIITA